MNIIKRTVYGAVAATIAVTALTACGGPSVEGTYMPRGDAFFDSLTFRDDDKVDVGLIGITHTGSYKIEDGIVSITGADGTVSQMQVDDNGCLSHPIFGVYCKGSNTPAAVAAGANPA